MRDECGVRNEYGVSPSIVRKHRTISSVAAMRDVEMAVEKKASLAAKKSVLAVEKKAT